MPGAVSPPTASTVLSVMMIEDATLDVSESELPIPAANVPPLAVTATPFMAIRGTFSSLLAAVPMPALNMVPTASSDAPSS